MVRVGQSASSNRCATPPASARSRSTAAAADRVTGDWFLAALVEERRTFYVALVARDPGQRVFLNGWLNRLAEFDVPMERLVA
jgi:hypothetical protein